MVNELEDAADLSEIEDIMELGTDPTPPERKRGRPRGSRNRGGVTSLAGESASTPSSSRRASGSREAPTPRALVDALKTLLGLTSGALELFTDVDGLAMQPEEARDIALPLARLMRRSRFAAQFATRLASSRDYTDLAMASVLYGMRVYPLIRYKIESDAARAALAHTARPVNAAPSQGAAHVQQPTRPASPIHTPDPSANGSGPVTGPRFSPELGMFGQFASS